ncbi:MAG: glycosyltransferase family 4 protein, partial [Candidatus Babeliales bacterium]
NLDPGLRRGDIKEDPNHSSRCVIPAKAGIQFPNIRNIRSKTITFIGRLVPEKGIFLLLEAFAQLKTYHDQWQLHFVGDGPAKEQLLDTIKNINTSTIKHIPTCSPHEVANMLASTDIFVLPSYDTPEWKEQFGHVIIEAMACGVPVITTTGGAITEVVDDAGLVCNQKDVTALAQSLTLLMTSQTMRETLAAKGIAHVNKRYTHEAIAHSTYRFWHKMVTST